MGNVLRPAYGTDDERLFPAGYIESASSTHTITLTDDFPIINDVSHKNLFSVFADTVLIADRFPPLVGTIRQTKLTDSLINFNDIVTVNILVNKKLTDILPIITDNINTNISAIYTVKLEDNFYIFEDSFKSSTLCTVKLEDKLINLSDIVNKFITYNILFTDNLYINDNIVKDLKLIFKEDLPLWLSDMHTQRFHWACVFAISKIQNNIGSIENIDKSYLIDKIEEIVGEKVIDSIDTVFSVCEINKLEDE